MVSAPAPEATESPTQPRKTRRNDGDMAASPGVGSAGRAFPPGPYLYQDTKPSRTDQAPGLDPDGDKLRAGAGCEMIEMTARAGHWTPIAPPDPTRRDAMTARRDVAEVLG